MTIDIAAMDAEGFYPVRMMWSVKYNCPVYVVNQSRYGESIIDKTYMLQNGKYVEIAEHNRMEKV